MQSVVYIPVFSKPFLVQMDALDVALVVVLSQLRDNGEHRLEHIRRKLQPQEQGYITTEK